MEAVSTRLEAARADLMSSRTDFDNSEQGVALARRAETPKNWWGRMHGSPLFQVVILGLILFLNPGLFNAVTSVGGAGLRDAKLASDSLTALYACFAVSGLLGGSVANYLGLRATLCIGSTGYSLYIAALLTSHIVGPKVDAFVITAGCILGITAGLLWTAYGTLILSLPTESQKGVWLSIPWALFNLGDVIGAALLLGETSDRSQGSVSTAGYSVVLGLTFLAIFLPWAMMPPRKITRSDGTRVITPRHPTFVSELKGLVHCFWSDPIFLLMVPFFFISNSFYAYHFNCFNLGLFSIRSRALNSLLYWIAQAMTAPLLGLILDSPRFSRRTRAKIGFCIVLALVMVVWGPTYHIQHSFSRENPKRLDYEELQMGKAYYAGVSILYFFCGVCDSSWQLYAYWVMGALSNNPRRLAYYNSLYKGLQSAGNAVFWRLDSYGVPFMTMLVATWASLGASLVLAAPMIIFRIRDFTTTDVRIVETEEQLDETTYTTIGTMENAHPSGETISLEDHHLRQRGASRFAADDEDDKALSKLETIEETPSVLARQASAAHPSSSFYEDKVIREEEEEEENVYPDANTRPH